MVQRTEYWTAPVIRDAMTTTNTCLGYAISGKSRRGCGCLRVSGTPPSIQSGWLQRDEQGVGLNQEAAPQNMLKIFIRTFEVLHASAFGAFTILDQ